jgi:hypothetical protein
MHQRKTSVLRALLALPQVLGLLLALAAAQQVLRQEMQQAPPLV